VSISSTLNIQNFCTNVHFGSFYYVHVTRKSCQNDVCTKKRAFYVDEIDGSLECTTPNWYLDFTDAAFIQSMTATCTNNGYFQSHLHLKNSSSSIFSLLTVTDTYQYVEPWLVDMSLPQFSLDSSNMGRIKK